MVQWVHRFEHLVGAEVGARHVANVYTSANSSGTWDAWIVFFPLGGDDPISTERETTQPNLQAVAYWASGLTPIYLEGALRRALALTPDALLARRAALAAREEAVARAEAEAYRGAAAHARELARIAAAEAEAARLVAEADAEVSAKAYEAAAAHANAVAKEAHAEKVTAKKARAKIHHKSAGR